MTTTSDHHLGFGIDIGGSGIKGALIDLNEGELADTRRRIATPQPATPEAVAAVVSKIVFGQGWDGPVGITIPSVVRHQTALSAANIDPTWINTKVGNLFSTALEGREVTVLNDADAAGLAESRFGDPRARQGAVIFLTLGTGIGSAFLLNGELFPNTEIGHLLVGTKEAEHIAAASVKSKKDWSYKKYARKLSSVLREYEKLFSPEFFIIGGGISRHSDRWLPHLDVNTEVIPAQLRNRAGMIGAAIAAQQGIRP
ncbi:polyphosphate--glucose phosphotransferase [Corynebacterium caspium]|uniref:polyphosphate--glucose phosphotransferase n=1 Tax=Corynebacterium caspium TaxID=234828 RepID=UPI000368BF4B|nr:ROK family protein [Corynebacterium caspium]WKD59150.1 Polyphosphate glucokinase [Corynebacterium caspium DSM 44850]